MQRILVIGNCGSGKSTASMELARRLALPLIHLDRQYWRPGWEMPADEDWEQRVHELIRGERWVIDGNFTGSLALRLTRADCVVWLDFPRLFCMAQVLRRVLKHHGQSRIDCGEDCPERLDLPFLKWVWDYPLRSRRRTMEILGEHTHIAQKVFRTRRELFGWIETLPAVPDAV